MSKRVLVIRPGAIGDAIQASSVLPGLKAEGWHVTFATETVGRTVLAHDPHIDEFIAVPSGKVSLTDLPKYWAGLALAFDRVVNLTETVEGSLLKVPARLDFHWSDAARRLTCSGVNYVELMHAVAGVPYPPLRQWFYPTEAEAEWARWFVKARSGHPLIVWAMAGSAQHKVWPYTPIAVARLLLEHPQARIVLMGGPDDGPLGESVTEHVAAICPAHAARVENAVGQLGIRESFAVAQLADVVVGPETGLLNAVALTDAAKIVLLSHSTATNLTRDWRRTVAVAPDASRAACHPCHRLHPGTQFCPQAGPSALCTTTIEVDDVVGPVLDALKE